MQRIPYDFRRLHKWFMQHYDLATTNKLITRGVKLGRYPVAYLDFLYSERKEKRNTKRRALTDLNLKQVRRRFSTNYKLKKQIFARDGACVWCGSVEFLEIDHIRPLRFFPSLALEPSNLRVLCRKHNRSRRRTKAP